jgi:FkbM family methyltransferase
LIEFYMLLQENVRLNGLANTVRCFNCAVGMDNRERELAVEGPAILFPTMIPPEAAKITRATLVPCTTLVDIIESNEIEHVDLLKLDCEGAEYEILYSTPSHYFERIREIHVLARDCRNAESLAQFLRDRKYEITRMQPTSPAGTNGNLWARHA